MDEGSVTQSCDYTLKILAVGNSGVGKTSLLCRYLDGAFPFPVVPTNGLHSKWRILRRNNMTVKLEIWVHSLPPYNALSMTISI